MCHADEKNVMGDEIRRGEMKTKMDTRKYATKKKKDKKKTCERSSITTPTMARTAMNSI